MDVEGCLPGGSASTSPEWQIIKSKKETRSRTNSNSSSGIKRPRSSTPVLQNKFAPLFSTEEHYKDQFPKLPKGNHIKQHQIHQTNNTPSASTSKPPKEKKAPKPSPIILHRTVPKPKKFAEEMKKLLSGRFPSKKCRQNDADSHIFGK